MVTLMQVSNLAKEKGYPMVSLLNFGITKPYIAHALDRDGKPQVQTFREHHTPDEAIEELHALLSKPK